MAGDGRPSRAAGCARGAAARGARLRRDPRRSPHAARRTPMTADRPADLVLTGGRIATMDAARSLGERARRPRRPDRGRRPGRRGRGPHRARRRGSSTCAAGRSRRASRTPTSTRSTAAWRGCAATSTTTARPRRGPGDVIAAYAGRHPDVPWIRGGGWYMADFPGGTPRREDLDAIVPDRPVFLTNRDGHGAWVNTQGARAGRASRPTRRPARRPHRARPGRHADAARSTKARWTSSSGSLPDDTPADLEEALRLGQALPALARDHRLAGRHRRAAHGGARLRRPGRRAAS